MARITDIPNEIFLLFFSHLPLKALIAARGINRHWRYLVPHADLLPTRRALLELYYSILESPSFISTRPWVLSSLRPFDRQGYLDTLLESHPYLPEEFYIWVLEWPARAVIGKSWPGLPIRAALNLRCDEMGTIPALNMLGEIPPNISPIQFGCGPHYEYIPALCLWSSGGEYTWLVLDKRDDLRGKVYDLRIDGNSLYTKDGSSEFDIVHANFIDWQTRLWRCLEDVATVNTTDDGVNLLVDEEAVPPPPTPSSSHR